MRAILLVIVLLLVLSFFGVSVQHIIESPAGQSNFSYVGDLLSEGLDALVLFFNTLWSSVTNLI